MPGGSQSQTSIGQTSQHGTMQHSDALSKNLSNVNTTALGMVPESVSTAKVATTFHDDAQVTISSRDNVSDAERKKIAIDIENMSIVNFLERPLEVFTAVWDQSVLKGFTLFTSLWEDFFTHSPLLRQKLSYMRFVKADLHVRVVLNTPVTSTGRMWLFFSPFDDFRGGRNARDYMLNNTGYSGVEIDAGTGQTAELVVPYWSPLAYADILRKNSTISVGRVFLRVLTPYRTADSADTGTFTIYTWFSDVSFAGLTDNNTIFGVGQSDDKGFSGKVVDRSSGEMQALGSRVGWVADQVIDLVGLSKPPDYRAHLAVSQVPAKAFTNATGVDNSVSLSCVPDAEVSMTKAKGPTQEDEMDIPRVIGRPNYVDSFLWTNADVEGVRIFAIPVTPTYSGEPELITNDILLSHVGFIANMAEYWRGSLRYRFSFVSNNFYSGRLGIVFFPGLGRNDALAANVQAGIRDIVDIRTTNEFVREVPFLSNASYLRTALHKDANDFDLTECTGTLVVYVVNSLRTMSTVSPQITINVWLSGAPDCEFGNFRSSRSNITGYGQSYDSVNSFGESVKSLRHLSRRFVDYAVVPNVTSVAISQRGFGGVNANAEGTFLHTLSFLYCGFSGSQRFKLYVTRPPSLTNPNDRNFLCAYVGPPISGSATHFVVNPPSVASKAMFQHVARTDQFTPFSEVSVPYYGTVPFSISVGGNSLPEDHAGFLYFEFDPASISNQDGNFRILSAAGDDFSFWYLIGTPPLADPS